MTLLNLYSKLVQLPMPEEMDDKLIHTLSLQVYQKLYAKAIMKQGTYKITLSTTEAQGFWLQWNEAKLPTEMVLEKTLLSKYCLIVHQKFAV